MKSSNEEDLRSNPKLSLNDKRPILVKEAKRLNLDVLCLSETQLLGQDNIEFDGYVLIWSGQEQKFQNGVAILMKKKWLTEAHLNADIKFISDRIIQISLAINNQDISIISIYAPTNTYNLDEKIAFYDQLQDITSRIPENTCLFVCGDFNARVGRSSKTENLKWTQSLGNYGTGIENENGSLLLEYCAKNELRICNTFFKHNIRSTWKHPRSGKWHQLDHILCRKKDSSKNLDCYVDPSAKCWTDHQMVILKFKLTTYQDNVNVFKTKQTKYSTNEFKSRKIYPAKLIKNCNPDFLEEMKHAVDQNIQKISRQSENMSISERYNKIINAVHEVCTTTFLKTKIPILVQL